MNKNNMRKKLYQKIIIIFSGLALLGSMVMATFSFKQYSPSSLSKSNTETIYSIDERLYSIIQGYETVLEREPNNMTAKQGLEEALRTLVASQIQAKNLDKTIPIMEKLTTLVPENDQYRNILKQIKNNTNSNTKTKDLSVSDSANP
ncbi:MAG: tetratricopeptide repeat protein [Candidatus Atelocyanobacterium sp. ALOHA_A2.5_9]|uniref:Tetratricopeptide repeat protein n=2 Tax=Candidatus Atelocyanobacterium thalassae TaxID=713887 RepID=D3ENK2_ATETH|nr:hypothetical protein UCYN_03080 [Candidatus Atelocyanobacterium thalassa isolate ALOHA]MCH2543454.1 tetratricopeptide repeat protein [Candidatus Atelocyanobacterium sp. ALOHA_A2.5_9]|tara:strand:- start:547 stop:987 length:441 start_codon:yes stop_codon:yes gene_type:complete